MTEHEQNSERAGAAGALGAATGVFVLQALMIIMVFLFFWGASEGASGDSLDGLEGFGYLFTGLLVAPVVAMIVGPIFAWKLRLRLFGWYVLSPPIAVFAMLMGLQTTIATSLWLAFLACLAWNLFIGAAAGRKLSLVILSLMIVKWLIVGLA